MSISGLFFKILIYLITGRGFKKFYLQPFRLKVKLYKFVAKKSGRVLFFFLYINQRSAVTAATIRIVTAINFLHFNRAAFTE